MAFKTSKQTKCLPPSKNLSRYISAPLQQTCRMRDLLSLTGSDPASVIWGLPLHYTTKPSTESCSLLPTHLCPFDWRPNDKSCDCALRYSKEELRRQLRSVFPGLMPALVQTKEGSHARPCQVPVQAVGDDPRGPHSAGTRRWDQPTVCHISYTMSLQRDFLSLSKFFRGFSGCQPAPTTLRRKPPVGRMFISAGRQGERSWGVRVNPPRRRQPLRPHCAPAKRQAEPGRNLPSSCGCASSLSCRYHTLPMYWNRTALSLKFPKSKGIFLLNCLIQS